MFGKKTKVSIEGMKCEHCAMKVKDALSKVDNVKSVKVDLNKKCATITGDVKLDDVKKSIEALDYIVTDIK